MVLKFYDDIISEDQKVGHWWMCGTEGISFNDIDEFIAAIPADDNQIDIRLHCKGGLVSEGWAIVDKLRATGKEITATIEGTCASMASVILLAASVRRGLKHAELLIHSPYIPPYTLDGEYRAEDLRRIAEDLEASRDKMLDFYVERTGSDRQVLSDLMNEDKFVDMAKAKELGFIHEIVEPASASTGGWKSKTHFQKNMAKENKIASAFKALATALGLSVEMKAEEEDVVASQTLMTKDGTEIVIETEEGADIEVGNPASPDGEHELEDGRTVVIEEGVITEIRPAGDPDEENEEVSALQAELATANARIAELEASQISAEQQSILDTVAKAGGAKWLEKVARSGYVPEVRKPASKTVAAASKSKLESRLEKLREESAE